MIKQLTFAAIICYSVYTHAYHAQCEGVFSLLTPDIQVTTPHQKTLDGLLERYGLFSSAPQPLVSVFTGLYNKRLSLQAFKKIESQWPTVNSEFKIIIFKEHLAEIKENVEIIFATFSKANKTFHIAEETASYYLLDFKAKDASDIAFLGMISSAARMEPIVLAPFEGSALKHLLNVPKSIVRKYFSMTNKMEEPAGPYITALEKGRISLELLDQLVTYEGTTQLVIRYLVNKNTLTALAKDHPSLFDGNALDVERVLLSKIPKNTIKMIKISDEVVIYDVTVTSKEDLQNYSDILVYSVLQGALTVP